MFCIACGTPLAAGLSYCNRCGTSLKERNDSNLPITAFLTAITLLGIAGLGIMLGGALSLTTEANLAPQLVGFFMLFTFLIVITTEVLLVRQLSKLMSARQTKIVAPPIQAAHQPQFQAAQPKSLGEPVPSVTENTTRTLEYEQRR